MAELFLESMMFLHGLFVTFSVVVAVIIASIILRSSLQGKVLRGLKMFAFLLVVLSFAVNLTGAYGYLFYRLPTADSPKSMILEVDPFAHEILFETMEYLGLIGPIWSVAIAWMIGYYGERFATVMELRRMLLLFIILFVAWTVAVSYTGLIPTMIAPVG